MLLDERFMARAGNYFQRVALTARFLQYYHNFQEVRAAFGTVKVERMGLHSFNFGESQPSTLVDINVYCRQFFAFNVSLEKALIARKGAPHRSLGKIS